MGMDGFLLMLCNSTVLRLTLYESGNERHSSETCSWNKELNNSQVLLLKQSGPSTEKHEARSLFLFLKQVD